MWVTVAFISFGLLFGLLLISQFWTLANEIYDARQAKRLFGFIGGGASLGGVVGATILRVLVYEVGSNNLLLISAIVLGLCVVIVDASSDCTPTPASDGPSKSKASADGRRFALLAESNHLKVMALVIGCAAAGAAIVQQQLSMAAEALRAVMPIA